MYGLGMLGYDDPRTRGLLTMGLSLLANSGPSMQPTSFGQRLGKAGLGAMGQFDQYMQQQIMSRLQEKRMERIDKQMKIMEQALKQEQRKEKLREGLTELVSQQMESAQNEAEGPLPQSQMTAFDLMRAGAGMGDTRMLGLGMSMLPRDYQLVERGLGKGKVLLQRDPITGQYNTMAQYNPPSGDLWSQLLQQQEQQKQQEQEQQSKAAEGPGFIDKYILGPLGSQMNPTWNPLQRLEQFGTGLGGAVADLQAGNTTQAREGLLSSYRGLMGNTPTALSPVYNTIRAIEKIAPKGPIVGKYSPGTLIQEMRTGTRKPEEMPSEYRDMILRALDRGELTQDQIEYLKQIGWL